MTDLEMTKLCAEAMGLRIDKSIPGGVWTHGEHQKPYDPLHDDAQAMALVKCFKLGIAFSGHWSIYEQGNGASAHNSDLNRAIVECVAKLSGQNEERGC